MFMHIIVLLPFDLANLARVMGIWLSPLLWLLHVVLL